jgi:tryptophanyl-tRNA synthetase
MSNNNKKILLSGIKPTGRPHIGNYFGAMKQFVEMQDDYKAYVFIADYHALTTLQDATQMSRGILDLAIDYLAVGLDPKKVTLFKQSDVPEHTELGWIFNCITTVPYLSRAHAYKDATAKGQEVSVGTFDYPMLMAADILLYDTDVVPVGRDQKQHVEYARDTAEKFNRLFGETFKLPEPLILAEVETVPGNDGRKMSKSYGNHLPLFSTDEEIKKFVMSIKTDSKGVEEPKNPDEDLVFALHKLVSSDQLPELRKRYEEGGIGYKESKDILVENLIKLIAPLRAKREAIADNYEQVLQILKNGANEAHEVTKLKMAEIRKKVGVEI